MADPLKSTRNLSLSTACSRVLGVARDIVLSAVLGGGVLMSAWTIIQTFANIFRRILGEGALGQAIVPVLSGTMEKEGKERTREQFTTLCIYLTLLMTAIMTVLAAAALIAAPYLQSELWQYVCYLTPLVAPYTVFICAVGVITSYLNMLRVYFLPSLTAVMQNVILIGALALICPLFDDGSNRLKTLCIAILISGVAELLFMFWLMHREKMQFTLLKRVLNDTGTLKAIWHVAMPGIFAASTYQLNVICDRLISGNISLFAGEIGHHAPTALYLTERLVTLPIGIFAVAFGTVALTEMSRAIAADDRTGAVRTMNFGLRNLLFISAPLTVLLFVFGRPILELLFLRGRFTQTDIEQTMLALQFYVFGIPAFAALKITTAAFTSRKDMRTPFIVGLAAIAVNLTLNLILMFPLRQGGIALATVVSSYLNNTILLILLNRKEPGAFKLTEYIPFLLKTAAASIAPAAAALPVYRLIAGTLPPAAGNAVLNILYSALPLAGAGVAYGILFFALAYLLKLSEAGNVLKRFLR